MTELALTLTGLIHCISPFFLLTMSHAAKALVLHCIDFRFVHDTLHEMKRRGLDRQYDDVGLAGAAKCLVDPMQPHDPEVVLRQIELSKKLHGITDVYLINHLDCGAYGKIFSSPAEELARHASDLAKAKAMVEAKSGLTVHTLIARLTDNGVVFDEMS